MRWGCLILVPVALPTLLRWRDMTQDRFDESEGYRVIVGAMWLGILLCSVGGLLWPAAFAPILLLQVLYKTGWLVVYALPRLFAGRARELPPGITISFAAIIAVWPWVIPWAEWLHQ
jgi:hypothetical protein